jgi:hypothetical protein
MKNLTRLGMVALVVAWCFDLLFWRKPIGINFCLFAILCLMGGFTLTWNEKKKPKIINLFIIWAVLFFSILTVLRKEPFTSILDSTLVLIGLVILSMTWLGGSWWRYNLRDYLSNALRLASYCAAKPALFFFLKNRTLAVDEQVRNNLDKNEKPEDAKGRTRPNSHLLRSVAVGIILGFPVIALLTSLLSSADPVFARQIEYALHLLRLEKIGEYTFRLAYICIGAYLLSGIYMYALNSSQSESVTESKKPWLPSFFGWIEATTIIGCVNLLFSSFVVIQFRYFFGGKTNINLEGYTYAEYARRGFGELIAVAVICLILLVTLGAITNRKKGYSKNIYNSSVTLLVTLVIVILISAFQRLSLYESAYGFTRLRAYSHVFMIWLGILLLVFLALEWLDELRRFALTIVLVSIGFGATLSLLNVDRFVVHQNVNRVLHGFELDTAYLGSLSDDAVPALIQEYDDIQNPPEITEQIGAVLACRYMQGLYGDRKIPWQSWHWSAWNAHQKLFQNRHNWIDYRMWFNEGLWWVEVGGEERMCAGFGGLD